MLPAALHLGQGLFVPSVALRDDRFEMFVLRFDYLVRAVSLTWIVH